MSFDSLTAAWRHPLWPLAKLKQHEVIAH